MSTAVATDKPTLKQMLLAARPKIGELLPKHMDPNRIVRGALLAASRDANLLKCQPLSVIEAVMQAAQLGLEINSALGSAYLVPFWDKKSNCYRCQLIPGYRGLVDLARRSGAAMMVEARVVYKGEVFSVEFGTDPKIVHNPRFDGDRKDESIVAVYAVATMSFGQAIPGSHMTVQEISRQFEVMTLSEIVAIRARSKSGQSGPWVTDFAEMAKKTVVKRLMKMLPLSPELANAIELDNAAEAGREANLDVDVDLDTGEVLGQKTRESVAELAETLQKAERQLQAGEAQAGTGD
jgi:recombination protein RecT